MTKRIVLAYGAWRAELAPEIGGSVLSLTLAEHAILRPTPDAIVAAGTVRYTACYPLVPYVNRIANGRFRFGASEYRLRKNFADSVHPLHGVGWQRPWRVVDASARACELRLDYRPRGPDLEDWPFAFDAVERFQIGPHGLTITLSVTNVCDAVAPVALGLHPVFPRRGDERLAFRARGAWLNGRDELPSTCVTDPRWDHSDGQPVEAYALDNDFYGWDGVARVEAGSGLRIILTASEVFRTLRVFTPTGRDFFAVEPVSHIADAINRPVEAGGGLFALPPGEAVAGVVSIMSEER